MNVVVDRRAIFTIALVFLCLVSVSGYEFIGLKWPDNEVGSLQVFVPSSDEHFSEWLFAIASWNDTGTAVVFIHQYGAEYSDIGCLTIDNDGVMWDGLMIPVTYDNETFEFAQCYLNYYYTEGYPTNAVRSVAVHEMGHSVGLGDMGPEEEVVMNGWTSERYGEYGIYTPQEDDIDGLYDLYY